MVWLGMAFGPLFWAPLSEIAGRRLAFLVSSPIYVLFNLAACVAKDMRTILVVRFFAGLFGAAQLSNMGGQVSQVNHVAALCSDGVARWPICGPCKRASPFRLDVGFDGSSLSQAGTSDPWWISCIDAALGTRPRTSHQWLRWGEHGLQRGLSLTRSLDSQ